MSKPEAKYQNSAGRLLAVLESLDSKQASYSYLIPIFFDKKPPDDQKQQSILGMKAVTELHILYAEFLEDLSNADIGEDEKSVLEKGLVSLESLMFPQAMNQAVRALSDAEKALLEVCATRLPKEIKVSAEDFEAIRNSINSLRSEVNQLPERSVLRELLLELVRLSEDSINRYHIYGAGGLKNAFKSMLSEVAEIYMQNEEDADELKSSPAWENAVDHLKLFDAVASKVMEYRPLIESASKLLLGG